MIAPLTFAQWQAYDRRHPAPTFFSRPAWALSLMEVYPGAQPSPLLVRPAGSERALIVPLMKMPGGKIGWREYCGFPLGGYTCFLTEEGATATSAECTAALREIERFSDRTTIFPWPLADAPHAPALREHVTAVVDLGGGLEAALSGVAGIFRRMAGQAERRGVVCERSDAPDAADRYYALLEDSAKRWGLERPHISKTLIDALLRNGGEDVQIWFAHAEGREIAGGIIFYGSQELFFWSAAMLAEYGRLRPSNALNFALLRAGAERGVRWYNLGASEGLAGVARFKRDLGAKDIAYPEIETVRAPFKMYQSVRGAFARPRAGAAI